MINWMRMLASRSGLFNLRKINAL